MLQAGDNVMVCVSGGADSMALLCVMLELRDALDIGELYACHFNHGLRGAQSDEDEAFVRAFCRENGVPLICGRGEMSAKPKPQGESVESWARALRYAFFFSSVKGGDDKIALAHNRNDCAETALFRLARGTGIRGMRGIPAVRGQIIRPLLEVSRAEIEAYCADRNISYRTDDTNADPTYARNRIRLHVLPELELVNAGAARNIARFCAKADEVWGYLAREAGKLLESAAVEGGWNAELLSVADPVLLDAAAQLLVCEKKPDADETALKLAAEVVRGARHETQPCAAWRLRCENGLLCWRSVETEAFEKPEPRPLRPGRNCLCEGVCIEVGDVVTVMPQIDGKITIKKDLKNAVDCGTIFGKLVLRTRESGDRFTLPGRGVTKSLKKLFNEMGLSARERETLPIVSDDAGIVWIAGCGTSARAAVRETTKRYFTLTDI